MNSIRDKIWYFLADSKANEILSGLIVKKYQRRELFLSIFLALATSSSVGAWAFWNKFPSVWLVIIAISQFLFVVKPYLLFSKYVKIFNEKSVHWQHLTVQIEELWHNINHNYVNEKEASKLYFELKQKTLSFNNVPDDIIFFKHKKQQNEAELECNVYLTKI
ncbi:hypothetical protein [Alkaliflexus imshenetskii]|uniref:hypothetical protein n=1 Tax=Alkaliflexus imshenetskii TaxID=286730 RepID=UPI00047E870A|nr:hypothetical protein [Alkaliflexus imshenetskii]